MSEPNPTYTTSNPPDINKAAVDIAAKITGVYHGMVTHWIEDISGGGDMPLVGTLQHTARIAYRAAVLAYRGAAVDAEKP